MYLNMMPRSLRVSTLKLTCGKFMALPPALCSIQFCRLPAQPLIGLWLIMAADNKLIYIALGFSSYDIYSRDFVYQALPVLSAWGHG